MERDRREACAEMSVGKPCEVAYWCHRWGSLQGTVRVRGARKYAGGSHAKPLGPSVFHPVGRDPCEGCTEWVWGRLRAFFCSGAVGGAPCGARSTSGVCRHGRGGGMRTLSLEPSVELPVDYDPCEGGVEICRGTLCESYHWGRMWNSLRHDLCEGCAEMAGVTPCEFCPWHRRWSSQGARTV